MAIFTCQHRPSLAVDVLTAAVFAGLDTGVTLAGASWWPAHPGTLAWAMLGAQAAADATLIVRRRAPLLTLAVLAAFTLAISLLIIPAGLITPESAGTVWAPYGTVLAAYAPFYYRGDRRVIYAAVGILTLLVARVWDPQWQVIAIGVLRTALGPLLALYFSAREAMVRALRDRAERAEREQQLLAEQARADERARLASEMHDVVTHRISLMVLQAGALGITAPDEPTRQAAEDLRAAGCQALDELRDVVGILQATPGLPLPATTPGLPALVAESTAVGTRTVLAETGDPALASPVVGRTIYRIVREALTNVRKHAPGATVRVEVSYGDAEVRLRIVNTAATAPVSAALSAAAADLAAAGSGLGLAGLRQRIEVVHGTMRAAPTADGGFCLEAALPAYVATAEPVA